MIFNKTILIAECGNNHEGDLDTALELLERAAECGVDLVKFQAGTAEGFARDPGDREEIRKYRKYELGMKGYQKLISRGSELNVPVFFSVWNQGPEWAPLRSLEYFKIAARQCVQSYIDRHETYKTFISVPIEKIHQVQITKGIPMHVVPEYPAGHHYLVRMQLLKKAFNRPVGYSDHTLGLDACVTAARVGACAIEKHFTLDHEFGPLRDHILSATPEQFLILKEVIREIDYHRYG